MTKQPKRHAYLVSVIQGHETARVYAVLASTPDEALKATALVAGPEVEVTIAGGLSREVAKRLQLKLGEPQPM
jgi:hypothetical protein